MIRLLAVILLLASYAGEANERAGERLASQTKPQPGQRLARRGSRPTSSGGLPEPTRAALAPALEPSERVERAVAAVGCTLVLTDRRLLVVRDGASFRPRSGVRSWPLDRDLTLRVGQIRRDTTRLVIDHAGRSVSVFLTAVQIDDAQALVARIRQRIYADD